MESHLRIVGAGLDRQIAAAAGVEQLIAVEARQVHQRRRPLRRQAVAILSIPDEQPGAEAEGYRQPRRRQTQRLAGIGAGNRGIVADRTRRLAAGHPGGSIGPPAQEHDQVITLRRPEVEHAKIGVALHRCRDAALVLAPKRLGCARRAVIGSGAALRVALSLRRSPDA